jgi:hypothetical protein
MKASVAVLALLAVGATAACGAGSSVAPTHPLAAVSQPPSGTRTGSSTPTGSSTAARNRAATQRETDRLLALAPLPMGASPTTQFQARLSGPAMGTPGTSSLIDTHRFWKTSTAYAATYAFIKSRRPNGLELSGTAGGSGGGAGASEGVAWDEPDRSYATGLELEVSVTAVPGGTLIRGDGLGQWIDPRPAKDAATGPRLHVTIATGCPQHDADATAVGNPGANLTDALLPAATPTGGLICLYGGLNAAVRFGLTGSVRLTALAAARLAGQVSRLPVGHTDGGEMSCPMDDGSFDVIVFSYPSQPDVDLAFMASGCQSIANGFIRVGQGLTLKPFIPGHMEPMSQR